MFVRLLGLMAFLLGGLITPAQQAAIVVKDSKTRTPVVYANCCFENLVTLKKTCFTTDSEGRIPNHQGEVSKLIITCVGYETLVDTVTSGMSRDVFMKPVVLNINEVVVTAQLTPERADKSIYKVNVLSSKLIEQKSATNLADLLESESNIRVSQSGMLGSNISMQGLSGENIKFLIDGVPVIGRINGNIDLNQLNLYNIDHVEIIEGPMSVIYGSNAIAGVINLITRENKNSLFTATSNAYAESIGMYNFNATASIRKGKNLWTIDGARNFFGGIQVHDTSRQMLWNPNVQYNGDLSYLYEHAKLRIKVTGQYFEELLLTKGALMKPYFETAFDNTYNTRRIGGILNASYRINADRMFTALVSNSFYNRIHHSLFKDLTTLDETRVSGDTNSYNSSMIRAWYNRNIVAQKFNYQTGIDFVYDVGIGDRIGGVSRNIGEYAYFLSGKFDPVKQLSIQPGIRFIYNTKYNAPLVYSMNLRWGPTEHSTIRASFAKGFRSPTFKELFMFFKDINHDVKGNPELIAESASFIGLNAVYNRETPADYISAELAYSFYNVKNKIQLVETDNYSIPPVYGYINVARLRTQSYSATTTWSYYPRLTVKAGITSISRHIPGNGGIAEYDKNVWNTDVSVSVNYKIPRINLSFSAFGKRSGRYMKINDDGVFDGGYVDPYNFIDFSAGKSLLNNKITVGLGVKNILDIKDVFSTGSGGAHGSGNSTETGSDSIAWGRSFFVKLAINFTKYQ